MVFLHDPQMSPGMKRRGVCVCVCVCMCVPHARPKEQDKAEAPKEGLHKRAKQ